MTPFDPLDPEFQAFIRKELNLPAKAEFRSCEALEQTEVFSHCIGTVHDGRVTTILIRGTFEVSRDAVILNLDLPGAPRRHWVEEALDAAGMDRTRTRLAAVCTNVTKDPKEAGRMPELQLVIIPI